ncbi:MAG: serine acetyltransferase [Sedimentisphaerales bacterium]|nr:serine acetyltransferase [Sedimentisphaerales bacterium]
MNKTLDKNLPRLTKGILASYQREKRTQRIGEACLPSRAMIVDVLDRIRQLLFPGYFGHKQLTKQNVQFHVGNLLAQTGRDLTEQIYSCICKCADNEGICQSRKKAEKFANDFLAKIPQIRAALALDIQAFYDGDPAAKSLDEIIYCYPGFYAVMVYRIAHELLELGVVLMPRIMTEYAHSITGTDIHPGAKIGKRFFIDHATGVVIGETTRIGDNVKIYQGVTLGAKSFPKDERGRVIKGYKRHPTIEDNVTIYPNATILGGETIIGKGATIGGNVYITESVAPHRLVKQETPQLQVLRKRVKKSKRT